MKRGFWKFIMTITGRRYCRLCELKALRRERERARLAQLMDEVLADLQAQIDAAPAGSSDRIRAINRFYELRFARMLAGV